VAAEDLPYTWEGVWDTNFGRMTLDAGGSGSYEWEYPGTITGHVQGNTLEGTWVQPGNQSKGTLTFTMSPGGRAFSGTWQYDSGGCGSHTCSWQGSCVSGACLQNVAASSPSPAAPGELVATATTVSGEVFVSVGGGPRAVLKTGDAIPRNAVLSTGVDANVTLKLADGTVMDIDEMTGVLVADLASKGSRQAWAVQVTLGKVAFQVNPKKAYQTDFTVRTASGSAGVRGTTFSVTVDKDGLSVVSVEEGTVFVDPDGAGLASVDVTAGHEVAMTRTAISPVTARGRALSELQASGDKSSDDEGLSPVVIGLAVLLLLGVAAGLVMARGRAGRPGTH
jgi:hypothetical protein